MSPSDRKYSREHEWAKIEAEGQVTVGMTQFAQSQLGDIVYLDLPSPGAKLEQFQKLGEVESVKAVSDLYSPIGGEVVEVNQEAIDHPEVVSEDPYERGWLLRLNPNDPSSEMDNLLTTEEYEAFLAEAH